MVVALWFEVVMFVFLQYILSIYYIQELCDKKLTITHNRVKYLYDSNLCMTLGWPICSREPASNDGLVTFTNISLSPHTQIVTAY